MWWFLRRVHLPVQHPEESAIQCDLRAGVRIDDGKPLQPIGLQTDIGSAAPVGFGRPLSTWPDSVNGMPIALPGTEEISEPRC
jgi:hypothetical protein